MKKALDEAGFLGQTTMSRFWYGVECAWFGSGYLAKVTMKKALDDTGLVTRTKAERVWYVIFCVYFGSGYLGKVHIAKALSEASWHPEDGYVLVPHKKWWYWVIALLVTVVPYAGLWYVGYSIVEATPGGLNGIEAGLGYFSAWRTFSEELSSADTLKQSGVVSEEQEGLRKEARAVSTFSASVEAIHFPSGDQSEEATLITDSQTLSANLQRLANNIYSTGAVQQIGPVVNASAATFVQAAAALGDSVGVTGISGSSS